MLVMGYAHVVAGQPGPAANWLEQIQEASSVFLRNGIQIELNPLECARHAAFQQPISQL